MRTGGQFDLHHIEKDKLVIDLKKTKLKLQKSLIRNEELNSQSKKYKEAISFLIFEVETNGKEVINTINTLENELDVKTDDQFKVSDRVASVKIPIRMKNEHVKTNAQDEGSKEIHFKEQDTDHLDQGLDAVKVHENESDLKTDDQSNSLIVSLII